MRRLYVATALVVAAVSVSAGLYFSFASLGIAQPGFSKHWYTDENGERHPYVLFLPYATSAEAKRPVILFLNGGGENGDDGVAQVSNNFGLPVWELRGQFPFVCIAPQMSKDSAWTNPHSARAKAAIAITNYVVQRYGGDPNRIYVTGPSSGGAGTFFLADLNRDVFAAIAPVASGYSRRSENLLSMPVWSFYNDQDSEVVNGARKMKDWLLQQGTSPHATEYFQTGHDSWTFAYRDPSLYHWMLRNSRGNTNSITGARFTLINPADLAASLKSERLVCEEDVIVNKGCRTRYLVIPGATEALHLEYRSQDLVPFDLALEFSPNVHGYIHIPPPELGSAYIEIQTVKHFCGSVPNCSFHRSNWNDLRISLINRRCVVELNGWLLMEAHLPAAVGNQIRFSVLLEKADDSQVQEFRCIRVASR